MFLPYPLSSSARGQYYAELGREGYYLEGGEPRGVWHGRGAEMLGLQGKVMKELFRNLYKGFRPDGEAPLVELQKRRGRQTHRPGIDGVFRPPKSVSVAWALVTDHEVRQKIQEAHDAAVRAAVDYAEASLPFARRGRGGATLENAGLCVALFQHGTSRLDDPDLHTHALFLNAVHRSSDASWSTLYSDPLYDQQKLLGAVYRAHLARSLYKDGWELERDGFGFRLKAVSKRLEELFSKRSLQMDQELQSREQRGDEFEGHAVRDAVARETRRRTKTHIPRAELFENCKLEAGCTIGAPKNQPSHEEKFDLQVAKALQSLVETSTYFTETDITKCLALAAQDGSAEVETVLAKGREALRSKSLVWLGQEGGRTYFAGRETLKEEARVFDEARRLAARTHDIHERHLAKALRGHRRLNDGQVSAVRQVTQGARGIACLEGYAGTGKTYALSAVREAYESAGYNVIGVATAAKAAMELKQGAKVENSRTIASCLWFLEPELRQQLRNLYYDTKYGKRRPCEAPVSLDKKTVLIIDEASMVGTRELRRLLTHARREGSKVILAGDFRQLPAINAAAPFRRLCETLGAAKLRTIIRQNELWEREAIAALANGDVDTFYQQAAIAGRIKLGQTKREACDKLLSDWWADRTRDPAKTLVLAATNKDRKVLNKTMQSMRLSNGEISAHKVVSEGKKVLRVGDRVIINRNNRAADYFNGDLGTMEAVRSDLGGAHVLVRLDRQVEKKTLWGTTAPASLHVRVPLKHLDLGYAITTHRAQGATVDRAFVMGGTSLLSRALAYVQFSRAREATFAYFSERDAGRSLTRLIRRTEQGRIEQKMAREKRELLQGQPPPVHGLSG